MKRKPKSPAPRRDLYRELLEGLQALAEEREGKRTLRTYRVEARPVRRPARSCFSTSSAPCMRRSMSFLS